MARDSVAATVFSHPCPWNLGPDLCGAVNDDLHSRIAVHRDRYAAFNLLLPLAPPPPPPRTSPSQPTCTRRTRPRMSRGSTSTATALDAWAWGWHSRTGLHLLRLFAVDYPFSGNAEGRAFMDELRGQRARHRGRVGRHRLEERQAAVEAGPRAGVVREGEGQRRTL
ncbi:hypothetical protein LX36DRAFT_348383 [Colletotrichum falcatum]|nr:hypothetical protein LX36DRAFT_348383 [Colletotrichum falcatum]